MIKPAFLLALYALILVYTIPVWAHAEHDKARYVAENGKDSGHCDKPEAPCQSIGYASKKANKGDKILVAQGNYPIRNVDELFYLTSELVPSYGGYSQADHYKQAKPKTYITYLSGVPAQYIPLLNQRGFTVIADKKAKTLADSSAFQQKLQQFDAINNAQTDVACEDGLAGDFPCHDVDLIAHVPLADFADDPAAANDIWGHIDLNTGTEYAIIGLQNGTSVVSLANPSAPQVVGHIEGRSAIWRDIKVYQYFDHDFGTWRAYAYVSTDGTFDKLTVINLSELPDRITEVGHKTEDTSLHNIYISNVNYGTGVAINHRQPLLHSMGSNLYGGAHRSYDLNNPENPTSMYTPTEATRDDYTHDGTSFVVTDDRVQNNCNRTETVDGQPAECDIFVDFNENEMRLWDQTSKTSLTELGQGIYNNAAYTHSGWWTEDKKYVYVHDELDEQRFDLNTSVIIFDVSDLSTPMFRAKWSGPTRAIDHNGFVRGNRYYMSNYERGMTILDITNPVAPVEIGYFDTFPFSDADQFNGAWGVYPFLPSGLILASDINSGLYILRDNTKATEQGMLTISNDQQTVMEGETVTLAINRIGGAVGEVSVEYQTLWGSATENDFTPSSGTLTWSDGDTAAKTITIEINDDNDANEFDEMFFVELFNPQSGATLNKSGLAMITIAGNNEVSGLKLEAAGTEVLENANADTTRIEIPVSRYPQFDSAINAHVVVVNEQTTATENQDYVLITDALQWAENEAGNQSIFIDIINDETEETAETLTISFANSDTYRLIGDQSFTINIIDDDSNVSPQIVVLNNSITSLDREVRLSDFVTVNDDQANLTYEWTFTSNANNATLTNSTSLDATLTMARLGQYQVELQVTDPFNKTANAAIEINYVVEDEASKSTGLLSVNYLMALTLLLLIVIRRRGSRLIKE